MKTLYKNFKLLDGTKDMKVRENVMMVVEKGKITKMSDIILEKTDKVRDLGGAYVLPGLINLHVHLPGNGFPKKKPTNYKGLASFIMSNPLTRIIAVKMSEKYAHQELLAGNTTIRTVGGLGNIDGQIRDKVQMGTFEGPRIVACNSAVTIPGGHMEGSVAVGVSTNEEFAAFVEKSIKDGADWIKIMITGGVLDAKEKGHPGEMRMTAEQVRVCCDTAHKHNVKVCAHVESSEGVKVALENGVDSIEHGSDITENEIALYKKTGAVEICTFSPAIPLAYMDPGLIGGTEIAAYNSRFLLEEMKEGTRKCLENGITVGMGTDTVCPFVTHYDFWREMEYFHHYLNMDRRDVLYTATLLNASILGIDDITGSLEEGKSADFIVTKKDPLESFANLRDLELVVAQGKEYTEKPVKNEICEKELDAFLAKLENGELD